MDKDILPWLRYAESDLASAEVLNHGGEYLNALFHLQQAVEKTLKALFNSASIENDLKWPRWERDPGRASAEVDWLAANGLRVRGHNLVWAGWRHLPG